VRVGQEPHVGDEVGVDGDAVLEAEAEHRHPQPGGVRGAEGLGDAVGELVHVEVAGVDHQVGDRAQVGQRDALALEAVEQPALALQRVRSAGRLLPADEHLVAGVEEDERRLPTRALVGERAGDRVEEGAGPHVDDHRDGLLAAAALVDEVDHFGQERRRQVVDHEEAEVLELLGRRAAAGPCHAGDDDELPRLRRRVLLIPHVTSPGLRRSPCSRRSRGHSGRPPP